MHSRTNTRPLIVLLFLIVGTSAFVVDILNPMTPDPLIYPRIVALAQLLFAIIRFSIPVHLSVEFSRLLASVFSRDRFPVGSVFLDVLDLTCVQLR